MYTDDFDGFQRYQPLIVGAVQHRVFPLCGQRTLLHYGNMANYTLTSTTDSFPFWHCCTDPELVLAEANEVVKQ